MNKRHAGLSALMSLVLLAGCSEVNQFLGKEESVNYKSAVSQRGEPLSIPPDLTQAASDPRYRAPVSGSTTYSQFQQQGQTQATAPKSTNVLPDRQDMRVERDGDLRWLVINRPPEDIFPRVVDFWTERLHDPEQQPQGRPDRDRLGREPRQDPGKLAAPGAGQRAGTGLG